MSQRLAGAIVQVKTGNTSQELLNKVWYMTYSSHRLKEITRVDNTEDIDIVMSVYNLSVLITI